MARPFVEKLFPALPRRAIRAAMFKYLSFALVAAFALSGAPAAAADTVYVVRHMQKAAGDDPALTAEGAAGAQWIADVLAAKGVTAVFATPTRRAEETAAPLAKRLGIDVTHYDPRNPAALAAEIASVKGAALVVGHSNTVPDLVATFGGARPASMSEQDYGTIFVVNAGSSDVQEIELAPAVDPSRATN